MFNTYKKITAVIFTIGMLAPQIASANFYVIPVGQSPIPTSAVKNFSSACVTVANGKTALPYTVPEGKAFVVTDIVIGGCDSTTTIPILIEIGENYKQDSVSSGSAYFPNNIYSYNLGIVMDAGEQIFLTNQYAGTSAVQVRISVSGYETRP